MDPFRLCLTLGPVAVYLLFLGAINLSPRPLVVSAMRDMAALGLALSGFVIVGPVELLFPEAAAARFGPYVWILLLAFYGLCLLLVVLLLRPRLIIYNVSADQLRNVLAELAPRLDGQARWAGDALVMPTLGVQLYLERAPRSRNVSLVSLGARQSHLGWRELEKRLAAALRDLRVGRNPRGASYVCGGLLLLALLTMTISRDPQAVAQALLEMLRL